MSFIYENDVSRTSANLQTTVAYLLSLHKNEYEWNMLGIRVVGHIDALPIPDGQYEYGDAYMVGTETPYEMYVYTRADAMHTSDYWFNIGKFPQPGPQGPAGSGINDVIGMAIKGVDGVQYNSTDGATITYNEGTITSVDPNTHEGNVDDIDTITLDLPIRAGQYLSMDADSTDGMLEVKVDDTELSKSYVKIPANLAMDSVPFFNNGPKSVNWQPATAAATNYGICMRNSSGGANFNRVGLSSISHTNGTSYITPIDQIYYNTVGSELAITKTSTNTGTIDTNMLGNLKYYTQLHIVYDNQLYYRMDPLAAPDGTLNFIHIDSIQDGSGGYKATGKCFSITTATRAWQVVDLDFGSSGSGQTYLNTVNLTSSGNVRLSFTISTSTPLTESTIYAKLAATPIMGIYCNLATTGSAFEPAQITFPNVGATNITVITGPGKQYTYTTNQLTLSITTIPT